MNNNPTPSPNRFRRWYIIMRRILTRGPNITLMNITHMFTPTGENKTRTRCAGSCALLFFFSVVALETSFISGVIPSACFFVIVILILLRIEYFVRINELMYEDFGNRPFIRLECSRVTGKFPTPLFIEGSSDLDQIAVIHVEVFYLVGTTYFHFRSTFYEYIFLGVF